jgi:hypothetical protein
MPQARTLLRGMAVPQAPRAVAYVAPTPGAAVTSWGTLGPRQGAVAQRLRKRPSTAPPASLSRRLAPAATGASGSSGKKPRPAGGAPALRPTKAGARGTPARRDTLPLARRARAGALTAVSVLQGQEAARRALTRARAAARRALTDAPGRLKAFGRRPARRAPGRAPWGPAPRRGRSAGGGPAPTPHRVCPEDGRAGQAPPARRHRRAPARPAHGPAWRWAPGGAARQAWRGGPGTVAVPLLAALGARSRFAPPRDLRPGLGWPPAASASGAPCRPGVGSPARACRGGDRSREPRPRPAPDGGQAGGSPPRRAAGATGADGWRRLCRCPEDKNILQTSKSCAPPLPLAVISTPGVSRACKRERSGRWRASAAGGL